MSYQARILAGRSQPIYLLRHTPEDGVASWFYVKLFAGQQAAFMAALNTPSFDCAQFGEVLASGHGSTPPSHVVWELEEQGVI